MKPLRTARRCLALLMAVFCYASPLSAQAGTVPWTREYELKAAFVYNIASFVDWPQNTLGNRVVIGFAGEGPMASVMTRFFAGKHIGPRLIDVRDVHSRDELRSCNILVIEYPDRSRVRETIAQLQGANILTVGDNEQFTRVGGVITFLPHGNTFQLAINQHAAELAQLKISSRLLSVAKLLSNDKTATRE